MNAFGQLMRFIAFQEFGQEFSNDGYCCCSYAQVLCRVEQNTTKSLQIIQISSSEQELISIPPAYSKLSSLSKDVSPVFSSKISSPVILVTFSNTFRNVAALSTNTVPLSFLRFSVTLIIAQMLVGCGLHLDHRDRHSQNCISFEGDFS